MPTIDDIGAKRRARLAAARLYLVCDSSPGGRKLPEILRAAIAGGVEIVQLRDKRLSDDQLTDVVSTAHTICEQLGALLVVNDRPHVALTAGADGVHVGQDDMPVAQVRELVGPELLIGLSTHTPAQIDAVDELSRGGSTARTRGDGTVACSTKEIVGNNPSEVDYIGVGPVHSTPTKPGRPATGLELVRHAAAHVQVPFFAIGGIHAGNVDSVLDAGAQRVAVVRAVADADEPEHAARALRSALDRAGGANQGSCLFLTAR
jgi:thiamine-phosphate pyrophosphorylase